MYFNDEQNSTNIDKEFSNGNSHKFNLNLLKNKYVLIGIGVVIVLLVGFFLLTGTTKTEYFLELTGLEDMTIYQNSTFVEPGIKHMTVREMIILKKSWLTEKLIQQWLVSIRLHIAIMILKRYG